MMHNIPRHFTASAVVVHRNHILLVHHKRIGAWLPPGGHIEPAEMPHQAAERETYEETGVVVEVVSVGLPDTSDSNAFFLPAPLCVHAVKAVEKGTEYYHIDLAFLCNPVALVDSTDPVLDGELPIINHSSEVKSARWVSLDRLDQFLLAKNVAELVAMLV